MSAYYGYNNDGSNGYYGQGGGGGGGGGGGQVLVHHPGVPVASAPSNGLIYGAARTSNGQGGLYSDDESSSEEYGPTTTTYTQPPAGTEESSMLNATTELEIEDMSLSLEDLPLNTFSIEELKFISTLGVGTYGRVFLVCNLTTNRFYALKIMRKEDIVKLEQVDHVINERNVLKALVSPFIVNLVTSAQNAECLYLLQEYVPGGELFSYLRTSGAFQEDVARFYAAEMVLALEAIHRKDVVYRDLKTENVLLDVRGHVKIIDFGFAKRLEEGERTYTICGTPEYVAPEIVYGQGHSFEVDWWALGVIVYEMLTGRTPFAREGGTREEMFIAIVNSDYTVPEGLSAVGADFLRCLLTVDIDSRLGSASQGGTAGVKAHPWFAGVNWYSLEGRMVDPPVLPATTADPADCINYAPPPSTQLENGFPKDGFNVFGSQGADNFGDLFPNF